jgi:K+-transporting ATPase c subunit
MTAVPHQSRRIGVRRIEVVLIFFLLGLAIGAIWLLDSPRHQQFAIPDEKAVAAALLNEKLSGPRYFHSTPPAAEDRRLNEVAQLQGDEPRISATDARAQVDRVAQERQFTAEQTERLRKLIDRLVESSPSRMVGEASINLLRLNLALDELQ